MRALPLRNSRSPLTKDRFKPIRVFVPEGVVFSQRHTMSDLHTNPVFSWLRDNADQDWSWNADPESAKIAFTFEDKADALRFKLKWGGSL